MIPKIAILLYLSHENCGAKVRLTFQLTVYSGLFFLIQFHHTGKLLPVMAKNTTFAIVDNGRFIHQVLTSEELLMNFEVVLGIRNDTDGSTASLKDHAHLATGHFNDSVFVIA